MIKTFEEFISEKHYVYGPFTEEDFKDDAMVWGVKQFDDEAEDDNGIVVFVDGDEHCPDGSSWKIYKTGADGNSWFCSAICIDSEDKRYEIGYHIRLELNKNTNIWKLKDILRKKLDGFF